MLILHFKLADDLKPLLQNKRLCLVGQVGKMMRFVKHLNNLDEGED